MANLTVQTISQAGVSPSLAAAAAGGDEFTNGGRTYFHVNNAGASPVTVTIDSVRACDQGADHNLTVSVPNAEERLIGPFDPRRFNNTSGRVAATYSAVTSVTVGAFAI